MVAQPLTEKKVAGSTPVEVAVESLHVDPLYQRERVDSWVQEIIRDWHDYLFMPVCVNRRPNGLLFVYDGGHRLYAARELGYTHMWAIITSFPPEEEPRLYRDHDRSRKRLTPGELFKARLQWEPVAIGIEKVVRESGWELVLTGEGINRPGVTKAFSALESCYRSYAVSPDAKRRPRASEQVAGFTPDRLKDVLTLIRQTWPDDPQAGGEIVIKAVDKLLRVEGRHLKRRRFIEVLGAHSLKRDLLGARTDRDLSSLDASTCLALRFRAAYNHALRVGRLIQPLTREEHEAHKSPVPEPPGQGDEQVQEGSAG